MFSCIKKIFKKEELKFSVTHIKPFDDKYVVVTVDGKSTLEPKENYKWMWDPNSYCGVKKGDKKGLIKCDGHEMLPPIYDDIKIDGEWVYALKDGEVKKYSLEELLKKQN